MKMSFDTAARELFKKKKDCAHSNMSVWEYEEGKSIVVCGSCSSDEVIENNEIYEVMKTGAADDVITSADLGWSADLNVGGYE